MNSHLAQHLPTVLPAEIATAVIQSSEFVNHGLPEEYLAVTLRVYVEALQLIWYVFIPMAGLGTISSCFVKHHSVRKQKQTNDAPADDATAEVIVIETPSNDANEGKIEIALSEKTEVV